MSVAPAVAGAVTPAAPTAQKVTYGPELVKNGGFTQGIKGWRAGNTRQKLVLRHGSKQIYGSVWAARGGALVIDDVASTVASHKAGTSYRVSADVRTQYGALRGQIVVRETHGSKVKLHSKSYSLKGIAWKRVTFTVTPANSGAKLDVSLTGTGAARYQPLQVDNVSMKAITTSPAAAPAPTPAPDPSGTPTATPSPTPSTTPTATPSPTPTATPSPTASPTPPPSAPPVTNPAGCKKQGMSGTEFGVALDINGGFSLQEGWNYAKSAYGTPEVVRIFHPGMPNWNAADVAKGATLSVSFKVAPKDVLSGSYDAKIRSWFRAAPDDIPIYWTYFHEPEENIEKGQVSAADYRAAWKRIVSIEREVCQPNLHSTLILMDWTVDPRSGRDFDDYYAGTEYIDVLAWDPYNPWQNNTTYMTPASIFDKVIARSKAEGKPFAVAETGSILMGSDKGTQRAAWLKSMGSYLESKGALYVSYFDTVTDRYDWRLKDTASKSAWKSVVSD